MSGETRSARISALMDDLFGYAVSSRPTLAPNVAAAVDEVFNTPVRGLREILLVITLARLLDPKYRASVNFYACNPRALFEGPIRTALENRKIPHGKSGPLNVAKAAEGINDQWSSRRRPREAARAVVSLVEHIESVTPSDLRDFAVVVHGRFLDEARRVEGLAIETEPMADVGFLFNLCLHLVVGAPDSGNTLQRLVGLLLTSYHDSLQTGILVAGAEDRASVTTTTSKKLGDLAETQLDGTVIRAYEVTTKPFNAARVAEAYDAVRDFDAMSHVLTDEIVVVCEAGQQPPNTMGGDSAPGYLGALKHHDLTFQFIDVRAWLISQLLRMPIDARLDFYAALASYVADPNTAARVKMVWRAVHEGQAHE